MLLWKTLFVTVGPAKVNEKLFRSVETPGFGKKYSGGQCYIPSNTDLTLKNLQVVRKLRKENALCFFVAEHHVFVLSARIQGLQYLKAQ